MIYRQIYKQANSYKDNPYNIFSDILFLELFLMHVLYQEYGQDNNTGNTCQG